MNRTNRITIAVVMLSGLVAFAERPPARGRAQLPEGEQTAGARVLATLPAAARDAIRKDGQAVLDSKSKEDGLLRAVIRFDRPRDEVFAVITQPSAQEHYLPHVTQSKTVGTRTAEGESIDIVVSFLFTFRYRAQHWFYPEQHRMEWNLDPKGENGLTEQVGFFQLYELDEHTTIAKYGMKVVARDGFLNFLRGLGERGGVAEAITAMREHVASTKVEPAKLTSR